jgi:tripartite-type tricarboxylate transporter receptor subunit TctC
MARLLAARLSATTGQTTIIENRAGAGTTIGSKAVATSAPDGSTLLFTSVSHAVSAAMYRKLDFDPVTDFAPVAMVAESSWVLVISPTVPAKSVAELVAYAKSHPGKLNFGFGAGTAPHLLGEFLKGTSGVDIVSVPYKGGAPAQADLLTGQIQMNFGTTATLLPFIESGQLRALAVTSNTRSPDLPNVPTMAESGFPHLAQGFWLGVLAPARTPSSIVAKLNDDINKSLNTPETTASMAKLGFVRTSTTAKTFAAYLATDVQRWSELVKKSGVKTN